MQLLSVALPHHDANLAWSDAGVVRYSKVERTRQLKRFHFEALADWQAEAGDLWGIDPGRLDDVAFSFDPSALPPPLRQHIGPAAHARLASDASRAEALPEPVCRYLGVRSGWLLSHHHLHALGTWMLDAPPPAVQVVIDGVGDGRPWSVYRGDRLVAMGDLRNGSVGWGIREAGKLLGVQYGHFNDIAGKVMGLQAYGRVDAGYLDVLRQFGFDRLKDVWSVRHWQAYRGDPLVGRLSLLDWIATVHARMGELLVDFFGRYAEPDETIAYSGGVAQNVVWNAQLRRRFPRLVVPPHASDEGLSLGGLEWLRRHHGLPPLRLPGFPFSQSDTAVPAPSLRTVAQAAQALAEGRVVGWYQGHGEVGPRALGNRSILLDPRLADGKDRLNAVKRREPYRPFGASVLRDHADAHFDGPVDPYMLLSCHVRAPAALPAITHVDGSCRVQAVDAGHAVFHGLLDHFRRLTGCPVLANTSLNLAGKPIAARPQAAVELFEGGALDLLVVGDTVYAR